MNLYLEFFFFQDRAWGDHWDEAIGEKKDLNPHIPKPDPPKEEEKKEEEEKKSDDKKEEDKEKVRCLTVQNKHKLRLT